MIQLRSRVVLSSLLSPKCLLIVWPVLLARVTALRRYGAAFVGFDEFWFPAAGALLALNTFGAEMIWAAVALPGALVGASSAIAASSQRPKSAALIDDSATYSAHRAKLLVDVALNTALALASVDCLASIAAVAIHRRHLMVSHFPRALNISLALRSQHEAACTPMSHRLNERLTACFSAPQVWAIFAPKYIMDAALHAAALLGVLAVRALV